MGVSSLSSFPCSFSAVTFLLGKAQPSHRRRFKLTLRRGEVRRQAFPIDNLLSMWAVLDWSSSNRLEQSEQL
jgi:hypothetical protein